MSLLTQVRNLNCEASKLKGLGLKHCKKNIERPSMLLLTEPGLKYNPVTDINLSYLRELIQKGKAKVLQGVVSMTLTAENTMTTAPGSGYEKAVGRKPYKGVATFDNGLYFHTGLETLNSYFGWDMTIFDSNGSMFFTETKQGDFKGFSLALLDNGAYMMADGDANASQTLTFQLAYRPEFDERIQWIDAENLDFSPEDLNDYNDVVLSLVAPAALSTTLLVNVISYADNKAVFVDGLIKDDFLIKKGVTPVAVVSSTPTTVKGQYSLVVPAWAAADAITAQLYDSVLLADIIDADGVLYKSNIATSIAV